MLYRSTARTRDRPGDRTFGCGQQVYNVIDVRQSYPQKVVKEAVRVLGHPVAADSSIHFAYEMVALTPAARSFAANAFARSPRPASAAVRIPLLKQIRNGGMSLSLPT